MVEVVAAKFVERDVAIVLTRCHFVTRMQASIHSMHHEGLKPLKRLVI